MGLKLRGFRAKLSRKQKKDVPEVVCLKYHISSEFSNISPHLDSDTISLKTNDVRSQKNSISIEYKEDIHVRHNIEDIFTNATPNREEVVKKPFPLKSILKKNNTDDNNINDTTTYNNNPYNVHTTVLEDGTNLPLPSRTESNDDNVYDLRTIDQGLPNSKNVKTQITLNVQGTETTYYNITDNKTINATATNELDRDFNIHNSELDNPDDEDSDDDEYSSQAASIFFTPASPKPSARAKNRLSDDFNA